MSGYSSKAEAMQVLRSSIEKDTSQSGLPTDTKAYNMSSLFDSAFYHRGRGWGWGVAHSGRDEFVYALATNVRAKYAQQYQEQIENALKMTGVTYPKDEEKAA